jgi:predicted nucleic acid-binding protein
MSVIVNNTVLSNLALINRLDLLRSTLDIIYLTPEVFREVENGIISGRDFQKRTKLEIEKHQWLFLTNLEDIENEILKKLPKSLHTGEASCLAVAKNRKWTFLTDDGNARNYARESNIVVSGTIGILISSIDEELITMVEGEDYLQTMIKNKYRSPFKHLRDIL